jgi:mono/diheme cytochrome c family protein
MRAFNLRWLRATLTAFFFVILHSPVVAASQGEPQVSKSPAHFDEQDGESLYQGVCQGCHMDQGQGAHGAAAYPALRSNPRLAAAAYPVYNILHGRNGMPPVGKYMDDAQVAAVVNYVRSHFDNHYTDQVTADDVKRLR